MIDDINAAPDYGDEPPHACSSVVEIFGARFQCGSVPGHADRTKHYFRIDGRGTFPKIDIEWTDEHAAAAREPEPEPLRYALVEQMGHRATIATIRETTFAGKPMIEVTDLRNATVHLVSPESLYEITWLTEADAFARIRPWKAVALPVAADEADDDDEVAENGGVWGFTKADL